MFDVAGGIDDLDRAGVLACLGENRQSMWDAEARELVLAAHWADLHNPDAATALREGRPVVPAGERLVRLGGHGTPLVLEFAAAEFGAVNQMHPVAAENLVADALDLRHRHPLSWAGIETSRVRVWKARKVAHLTAAAGLRLEQARFVDAAVVDSYETLPWARFLDLVNAAIIEADPQAAEARRLAAEMDKFVRTGQSNEFGLKLLVAKAAAGDVIFLDAMVDRIARILAGNGDTTTLQARRATALGILANPARALALLEAAATEPEADDSGAGDVDDGAEDPEDRQDGEDPDVVREHELHPADNDADDPPPASCPTCVGAGTIGGKQSPFARPVRPVIDPAKLRPPATLYLHMHQDSFTGDGAGVARFEGVGPETPHRIREALHLRNPASIFPWSPNTSRRKDSEHTVPYRHPDTGGPPGQTSMANLGLIDRFPHRLKTRGRWRLHQPEPGVFVWRSPHGYYFLVDHTGTRPLPRSLGNAAWPYLGPGIDIAPSDGIEIDYGTPYTAHPPDTAA